MNARESGQGWFEPQRHPPPVPEHRLDQERDALRGVGPRGVSGRRPMRVTRPRPADPPAGRRRRLRGPDPAPDDHRFPGGGPPSARRTGLADRVAVLVSDHPLPVLLAVAALTLALAVPMVFMAPDETASQNPDNEVTRAQDLITERFASPIHVVPLVIEAADGNILSPTSLLALRDRNRALVGDSTTGPILTSRYLPDLGVSSPGVATIAEAVDLVLADQGQALDIADPVLVHQVVDALIVGRGAQTWGLAHQAVRGDDGQWRAPALLASVEADNEALGGGSSFVAIGADDLTKEEFARDVVSVYRADPALNTWAIAADVNLTSIEEGTRAGPFIGLTVFVVLIIVMLTFRSYWLTALTGLALGALMIWLKGLSNLVGLESDQLLATIVPISMISFGIDSTFHVFGRYREADGSTTRPRVAFRSGLAAVLAPVVLALSSDSAAFLSNLSSPIESVRQFGLAAAMASLSAFVLLGLATPLAAAEVEERLGRRPVGRGGAPGELALGAATCASATLAVLLVVFVSPVVGTAVVVLHGLVAIGVPLWRGSLTPHSARASLAVEPGPATATGRVANVVQRTSAWCAARPGITVGLAAFVSGFALFHALGARASFEVTDFFAPDVDFVVGIDRVTLYAGDQAGEAATVVVEADLSDPASLAAVARFADDLRGLDTELLARDGGGVIVDGGAVDLVRAAMDPANTVPGSNLTFRVDADGDGLPDNRPAIDTLLADVAGAGIVDGSGKPVWAPELVPTAVARTESGQWATQLVFQVPETSSQATVTAVRDLVEPMAEGLESELASPEARSSVTLTGSPIFRDEQLRAVIRSLLLSLPIAVVLCWILASAFTRSMRLALLTTIPVLLVVVWLYGFMTLAGFGINVVTATIGAISIGVGIDFATHMTMRLVEEHERRGSTEAALDAAARGTGVALTGSALTSIAGFAILSFAPMPLFATYGLLTASMILFSLLASIAVLPSLLLLFGDLEVGAPAGDADASNGPIGSSPTAGQVASSHRLPPVA